MKSASKYIICYDIESGGIPSAEKPAFDAIALIELAFVVIDMEKFEVSVELSMIFPRDYKEVLIYTS